MSDTSRPRKLRLSQRAQWASGQPVSHLMAQALQQPQLISLAAGFVDPQTLPTALTNQALEIVFSDPDKARSALQYGTTPGYLPLREALLARTLEADRKTGCVSTSSVEQIVVTAGSNQLLHLVCDTILDPGDIVVCAAPSYFVFLGTLANLGARSVGVAVDQEGIIPDALDEELDRLSRTGDLPRVKAIYVTSYFDNPRSVSVARERRIRLVEIAHRWSKSGHIHIIEDTAYRELRYLEQDQPSIRAYDELGDTVVMAGTFSKSYSPGIRIGWGILPHDLMGPVCDQKGNFDFGSPNLAQQIMAEVLQQGLFDQHLDRLRDCYRTKLTAMLQAADEFFNPIVGVQWIRPTGGLYVWVTLPESIDSGPSGRLFHEALNAGVLYVPGEHCYPLEGPQNKNTLRLSFGVQTVENIRQGVALLATAIQSVIS